MKVAINGFGRIGRNIFKILHERKIPVCAINDIHGVKDAYYLLKHDSIYGNFKGKVSIDSENLFVDGKKVIILQNRNPEQLPWKKLGVDIVIESTGAFRDKEGINKHFSAGAKKVIVTAPSDDVDITLVPSVNDSKLNKNHKIISIASCTTNASAPVLKILDKNFGIENVMINTIHSYTSSQSLVDSSNEKPRRGRAAAVNLIPTSTGASKAVCEVIPELKGKISGVAIRVPIADGSIVDVTASLKKDFEIEEINNCFKNEAKRKYKGIIEYSEDELVSSDIVGSSYSGIFDSKMTMKEGKLVKVLVWYDNEYGYSNRVVDVLERLKKFK